MNTMGTKTRWLVVGTGGIGGYFGGLLAFAGHDVTFLARGDHLTAMQRQGLRVETVDGTYEVGHPRALELLDDEAPFDVVLFCVKTYDNATAAKIIEPVVGSGTVVISIQNGMDNDKALADLLPEAAVFPGLAKIVSARVAPGLIRQSAGPRTVLFGDPHDAGNATLQDIAGQMRSAKIDATASRNIGSDQWDKFVFIVAFSGMTALCRSPIGAILNDPDARQLYHRCVEEAVVVATKSGVHITSSDAFRRTEAYRGGQEHATSSLLSDVLAGRPTEIESLNGAVVRRAREYGLDVPVNAMIHSAIRLSSVAPE